MTRCNADGNPAGGWLPNQKLNVAEALELYTAGSAFAEGLEQVKGCLSPGYLADFVLLDRDLFTVAPEEIKEVQVLASWIGGKQVYQTQI